MSLHHAQELDNNLRARTYQDLTLACLLGIVDGVERIVENAGLDHFGGVVGLLEHGVSGLWEVGGRDSQLDTRGEVSTWRKFGVS